MSTPVIWDEITPDSLRIEVGACDFCTHTGNGFIRLCPQHEQEVAGNADVQDQEG